MTLKQLIFWPSSKMNLTFGRSNVCPFLFSKTCLWLINYDSYYMIYFSAEDEVKFNSSIVTKLQIDLDRNDRFLSEGNDQIFSIIDSSTKLYSTEISFSIKFDPYLRKTLPMENSSNQNSLVPNQFCSNWGYELDRFLENSSRRQFNNFGAWNPSVSHPWKLKFQKFNLVEF